MYLANGPVQYHDMSKGDRLIDEKGREGPRGKRRDGPTYDRVYFFRPMGQRSANLSPRTRLRYCRIKVLCVLTG